MKQADETIERVLTELRVVEPPTGMHGRLHAAMQSHEAVVSAHFGSSFRGGRFAVASGLLLAMGVLLLVTMPARRQRRPMTYLIPGKVLMPDAHFASVGHPRDPAPPSTHVARRKPAAMSRLVSYPAAPMPLTDEEKLLLRVAHGRDANNLAVLDPRMRAAQTAKATTEFQHFFDMDGNEMRSQIE